MEIDPFIFRLSIFVLSIFIGYYVVWSVTPSLHTPLMSVTNAISSVIIVGAIIASLAEGNNSNFEISNIFGFFAIILAAINIFGGFLVTQRMLQMYKKKKKKIKKKYVTEPCSIFILNFRDIIYFSSSGAFITWDFKTRKLVWNFGNVNRYHCNFFGSWILFQGIYLCVNFFVDRGNNWICYSL